MMKWLLGLILLGTLSVGSVALADDSAKSPQIDPALRFMQAVVLEQGPKAVILNPGGVKETPRVDGAGALLRFVSPLTKTEIAELQGLGVKFARTNDGRVAHLGPLYRTWLPWLALEVLAEHPTLIRAEATWEPMIKAPLEVTSPQIGAPQARARAHSEVDGAGILIANIDSAIDVLHPAFFRADGEHFDWIDVNNNGRFDPGVDAVDLNGNGIADRNEILRVLDGTTITSFTPFTLENRDGVLQVELDWLFADMNGDGERNAGRAAGFTESDPGYGEPLFVVEDINGNGELDVGERLIMLKTSKIRKVIDRQHVYTRGVDLIDAGTAENLGQAHHGTGVTGILLGGQPGFHSRVGIAPGADVIVYGYSLEPSWDDSPQVRFIEDAMNEGVDILLHEWTNPFTRPMDGSTNLEAAMDLARDFGMLHVNPMGNLNLARKHLARESQSSREELNFLVGDGFRFGQELYPYTAIYGSLQWRGEHVPAFELRSPAGLVETIRLEQEQNIQIGGVTAYFTYEKTRRDTHIVVFYLWTEDDAPPIDEGTWTIGLSDIREPDTFYGRISDYHSSWSSGVIWEDHTGDEMTLSFPATADSAFGVAAYGGRHDMVSRDGSRAGELRSYSGRGPRVDGSLGQVLAAPDDPYAPLAATPQLLEHGYGRSWYSTFGGTSGAGPHLAGAFALLMQHNPEWNVAELQARMLETADRTDLGLDPQAFPDRGWGAGKLNVYRALHDEEPRWNQAPVAALDIGLDGAELVFDARESSDPDGDVLEYRFDFRHDGQWDTGWQTAAVMRVPRAEFSNPLQFFGRLEVRDPHGATAGRLTFFDEGEALDPGHGEADGGPGDAGTHDVEPTPVVVMRQDPENCDCATTRSTPGGAVLLLFVAMTVFRAKRRRRSRQHQRLE